MDRLRVAFLGQADSPLGEMLGEVLAGAEVRILNPASPDLPQDVLCGGRLALWDLWGSTPEQIEAWTALLKPDPVGLVLASAVLDEGVERLALECRALGLIGPAHGAGLARAVLRVAAQWQEHFCSLLGQLAQVKRQLADREVIERAKSILIAALGLSEPEAMSKLQRQARRTNQKLVEVAQKVIATNRIFNGDEE